MEYVLPVEMHDAIITAAYQSRGYTDLEARQGAQVAQAASRHGVRTHNGIKALELDAHHGSQQTKQPGCVPGASIEKLPSRFAACEKWNSNRKLGQSVALEAMDTCMRLADEYGVGVVSVDNAFHYLWGGGYVMSVAKKGYIGYTHCTSTKAEVVPFGGRTPTVGTDPHSWGFPTTEAVGFPVVMDFATSVIAFGRVNQYRREGLVLPANTAVDEAGKMTTDPHQVAALLPVGGHKGYGLAMVIELTAALIGGSLPVLRGCPQNAPPGEKSSTNFFFQVIHPDALDCGAFAAGRDRAANVKAVIEDVLGHGNDNCLLPGQIEHEAALRSRKAGGLIFSEVEIDELARIGEQAGIKLDRSKVGALEE